MRTDLKKPIKDRDSNPGGSWVQAQILSSLPSAWKLWSCMLWSLLSAPLSFVYSSRNERDSTKGEQDRLEQGSDQGLGISEKWEWPHLMMILS